MQAEETPPEAQETELALAAPPTGEEAVKPVTPAPRRTARRDSWDWVIASVCISAGVIGLRTVNDPVLWSEWASGSSKGQVIGQLLKKKGGVRYRSAESPLWHDVFSGSQEVAAGDTVFTSDDGQAELRLQDGSVAEIEPNSLIVVQRSTDFLPDSKGWLGGALGSFFATEKPESLLRIEKGTAKVNLKKDAGPLRLQVKGKIYNLSSKTSGEAEVSVEGKGAKAARFAAVNGSRLELSEAGAEANAVQVSQGEQAVVGAKAGELAVQSIGAVQVAPASGERLVQEPGKATGFRWSWQGEVRGGRLEIEGAEKKEIDVDGKDKETSASLAPGAYRWRLSARGAGARARDVETPWRSFELLELTPPVAVGPVAGAWVELPAGEAKAGVLFSWREPQAGLRTEVEWWLKTTAPDAKPEPHRAQLDGSEHELELGAGQYQWHLRASAEGRSSDWSALQDFSVGSRSGTQGGEGDRALSPILAEPAPPPPAAAVAPPPAPEPVKVEKKEPPKPVHRKQIRVLTAASASGSTRLGNSDRLDQVTIPLRWEKLEDADQYDVKVVDDSTRRTILERKTTQPQLNLSLHSLASVHYSYQVTAIIKTGERIVSPAVPFEVEFTAPVLKTPPDGTRVTPSKQGTLLITWERTVLTDSYTVQISQDPSFSGSVREETATRNLLSLRGLKTGLSYYWRVRSIAHGHKSEWSQASLFVLEAR